MDLSLLEQARPELDEYLRLRGHDKPNFYPSVRDFYQLSQFHFRRLEMLKKIGRRMGLSYESGGVKDRNKILGELAKGAGVDPEHWISGLADPAPIQFFNYQTYHDQKKLREKKF